MLGLPQRVIPVAGMNTLGMGGGREERESEEAEEANHSGGFRRNDEGEAAEWTTETRRTQRKAPDSLSS